MTYVLTPMLYSPSAAHQAICTRSLVFDQLTCHSQSCGIRHPNFLAHSINWLEPTIQEPNIGADILYQRLEVFIGK